MIPHNPLTGKTPAYIVIYVIIRIEQYFCREPTSTIGALQRDHAMVRTWSIQDSSVGPVIRLFSGGLDIKKAWTATHLCTNNKAAGYCKAMSKIIYTVGKKIKISHNLKSKEIKIMFKSSHSMKKAKNYKNKNFIYFYWWYITSTHVLLLRLLEQRILQLWILQVYYIWSALVCFMVYITRKCTTISIKHKERYNPYGL